MTPSHLGGVRPGDRHNSLMTPSDMEAEALRCEARGDSVTAAVWRARAACTRAGRILPSQSKQMELEVRR